MANVLTNRRLLRDATLKITKALPGTSSTNTSDTIDIGSGPFNPEEVTVEVSIPAIAAHVTVGNVPTITLYHGDATNSLAATDPVVSTSWPGVGTTGSAGKVVSFKLPAGTKRYIAFYQTTGGTDDISGSSITYSLLV